MSKTQANGAAATDASPDGNDQRTAEYMADQLCEGFIQHDKRNREAAIEAFGNVDAIQFAHIDDEAARRAAEGYVDALWAKDDVEDACRVDGEIDPDQLVDADWSEVEAAFERRAEAAGIDPAYAELTTEAWINHKTNDKDYWTPTMHAQMLELRAALQDPDYPHKPRSGQGGFGPEPVQYVLGIEFHDKREWKQARKVVVPYFQRILDERED